LVTTELIRDPQKRKELAAEKESWALYFLREEIYSSTAILANEMRVGVRAARNVLNRMEKKGLLVKDEVRFMGSKALPLWGITSAGIMHGLDPSEVAHVSLRYHRVRSISALTIEHTLDVQRCRQYYWFSTNCLDWTSTRFLPGHNAKRRSPLRWPVYPDGLVDLQGDENEEFIYCAIEVERSRKTPARYVQLIRGHLRNIQEERYSEVFYYCPTQKMANSLEALFERLIHKHKIKTFFEGRIYDSSECMHFFKFGSMELFSSQG